MTVFRAKMIEDSHFDFSTRRVTPSYYRDCTVNANCSNSDRMLLESACAEFVTAYVHTLTEKIVVDSIVTAARHPRKVVWETGILMLAQLAQTNLRARTALSGMASDSVASNRSRAMLYLSDQYPRIYCIQLLLAGIRDRSSSVAHVAAWSALTLDLHELADAISIRLKTVEKPIARLEFEMIVGLLRNGFFEYYNENGYNIVVSFPERFPNRIVWPGRWLVPEGEVQKIGLAKIRDLIEESPLGGYPSREWQWQKSTSYPIDRSGCPAAT